MTLSQLTKIIFSLKILLLQSLNFNFTEAPFTQAIGPQTRATRHRSSRRLRLSDHRVIGRVPAPVGNLGLEDCIHLVRSRANLQTGTFPRTPRVTDFTQDPLARYPLRVRPGHGPRVDRVTRSRRVPKYSCACLLRLAIGFLRPKKET